VTPLLLARPALGVRAQAGVLRATWFGQQVDGRAFDPMAIRARATVMAAP